ncbi:succinate-semialdehyde dehydrogenase [Sinomonas cellulolyticus]|uniref:NAD-dependent succinate-semialdehyde dehydrogenase n=1 Tax=Sinomonas cellulolyticus TaxID=2801916 RepID=A0ABS1K6V2_9MICC|nr:MULTISPECIES: NAD-dependent succinate-semialdehyde dehydrogenase [Sinomonas]MBL0706016.1 NAD-dependent succinate-semialdehyde dehydrogenase [Sinomonas cellulolyticus]GHG43066.1 succinate-semialdehyde dehydrogenase [Sinomonas sp. KCTC 49339]
MTSTASTSAEPGYRVLNPATGEVVETFPTATDAEIESAIASATEAYASWRETPIEDRAKVVSRIAELFTERADELAAIITTEMGKPLSQSKGEAEFCTDIFKYFAEEGPALAADQEIRTFSGGRAVVQKLPIGPLLGIMPWNYPYYQVARFAAPNLMLGNTIILKHAESCPRSALAIQQIMDDAGVPRGAYVNVFASHQQIADIIADPRVQGVSLTGSERAGAIIGELAGKNLKKAVLELGGSDPFVVLDAADPKALADTAWDTRMENTGQACNSNKRMIVAEDVFDDFVAQLTARAQSLKPGNPAEDADGTFAPLSSRAAAEGLAAQVQDALDKGATLHAGGVLSEGDGAYYSPAVLTGVTAEMRAYKEELFGPVAVVYKVSSDEEALRLANDTPYGLGGAVFSEDTARAEKVAQRLEVGMANVNTPAAEGAEVPFGGVKRSGFGRELGPLGMDEFVNKRMYFVAD